MPDIINPLTDIFHQKLVNSKCIHQIVKEEKEFSYAQTEQFIYNCEREMNSLLNEKKE